MEARYTWNRRSLTVIGIAVAFCLVVAVLPASLWLRILCWGVFGLGSAVIAISMATGRTALRIDASGIAACSRPYAPGSSRFYPWEDLRAIMIWRFRRMKTVGFVARDGVAPQRAHWGVFRPGRRGH